MFLFYQVAFFSLCLYKIYTAQTHATSPMPCNNVNQTSMDSMEIQTTL